MAGEGQGGFGGVQPVGPFGPPPYRDKRAQYGGRTLGRAVQGAVEFKKALGLPSFEDIWNKIGGGNGTIEYGNAGAAGAGANVLKGEMDKWRSDLTAQRGRALAARAAAGNPTGTEGFKAIANLNAAKLTAAQEDMDRQAAEAASRRGYAGGYNPARTERERLRALASSNAEAALAERDYQLKQQGEDTDLLAAQMPGYTASLGGYTDLTKTLAELPTKYLTAYSNLLGGMGNYGDIFSTALKGSMFEEEPWRMRLQEEAQAREDARRFGYEQQGAEAAFQRGERGAVSADERSRTREDERLAQQLALSGRGQDAYGRRRTIGG